MNDIEFKSEVLDSPDTVMVDYWADWCGPCSVMGPILDRVAASKGVKLVKINVDENPEMAQAAGVSGIPTVHLYQGGEKVAELIGAQTEERLLRKFQL